MDAARRSQQVDVDDAFHVRVVAVGHATAAADARVVDQNVDATVRIERACDQLVDIRTLTHIGWHGECLPAACFDLSSDGGEFVGTTCRQHDRRASLSQRSRRRRTDTGRMLPLRSPRCLSSCIVILLVQRLPTALEPCNAARQKFTVVGEYFQGDSIVVAAALEQTRSVWAN